MPGDANPIKCAKCNMPVKVRAEPNDQHVAFCPVCGISDRLENVQREAAEFAGEQMQKHFQATMKKSIGSAKAFEFTPGVIPHRTYRFIVDIE